MSGSSLPVATVLAMCAIAASTLCGCGNNRKTYAENAQLRSEKIQLQKQVEQLEKSNAELKSQLQIASAGPQDVPAEVRISTPQVAHIEVGRLSHARDMDGDGVVETLVVYLHPVDGRERFTQMVGELTVTMTVIPADGEPQNIGRVSLTATQVRDAYRSSITGTHYTVEVPITAPQSANAADAVPRALVQATYIDGYSGQQLAAERMVALD